MKNDGSKTKRRIFLAVICLTGGLIFMGAGYALGRQGTGVVATVYEEGQNRTASRKPADQSGLISLEEAREKALADAGLTAEGVTFFKEKQDMDPPGGAIAKDKHIVVCYRNNSGKFTICIQHIEYLETLFC